MRAGTKRASLEEEEQHQEREKSRAELCQRHGVSLVGIDVVAGESQKTLDRLRMALSDASRRIAKSDLALSKKTDLMERNSQARTRLSDIVRSVRQANSVAIFEDLWRDRQYAEMSVTPQSPSGSRPIEKFRPGMCVQHIKFGRGVVDSVEVKKDDTRVTVTFQDGNLRVFAASLVAGKLIPEA